jgi:hypothetical protein
MLKDHQGSGVKEGGRQTVITQGKTLEGHLDSIPLEPSLW